MREVVGGGRLHQRDEQLRRLVNNWPTLRTNRGALTQQQGEIQCADLDGRLRDLEIGLVTNKRAIQAIYDSRIWKAFWSLGGLLLRMTGRNPDPNRAASWPTRNRRWQRIPPILRIRKRPGNSWRSCATFQAIAKSCRGGM